MSKIELIGPMVDHEAADALGVPVAGLAQVLLVHPVPRDRELRDVVDQVLHQQMDRRASAGTAGRRSRPAPRRRCRSSRLAVILMYLMVLPKVRPALDARPRPGRVRFFSSRMMSADSLAMSTAVSTEMPTSAVAQGGGVVDAVAQEADGVPLGLQGPDDPRLLDRVDLGEDGRRRGQRAQRRRRPARRSRSRARRARRRGRRRAQTWRGDELVVAGDDLDRDARARRRRLEGRRPRLPSAGRGRRGSRPGSARPRRRPRRRRGRRATTVGWPRRGPAGPSVVQSSADAGRRARRSRSRSARPCVAAVRHVGAQVEDLLDGTLGDQECSARPVAASCGQDHGHRGAARSRRGSRRPWRTVRRPTTSSASSHAVDHRHVEQVPQPVWKWR